MTTPLPELMTSAECAALIRVQKQTILTMARQGTFPPPLRLSARRFRWVRADVEAWLAEQQAAAARRRAVALGKGDPAQFRVSREARQRPAT